MNAAAAANGSHESVLLHEALDGLALKSDGFYVDGTFGRGGHARAILQRLDENGRLWVIDRDPDAIAEARRLFGGDPRCRILDGSFSHLGEWLREEGVTGMVNGILLDLGVSSPQLDRAERGFSFLRDGPLDMRMDPAHGPSALVWLQEVDERDLVRVLKTYGEERFARRIARAVVAAREAGELPDSTLDFAALVAAAVPKPERHKHPATRTFQAVRIAVNGELDALEQFLDGVCDWLAPGGRLAVISFHSLEDRMVKRFIQKASGVRDLPPDIPVIPEGLRPRMRRIGKAMRAGEVEIGDNPRARSAMLRVAEKLS
ncbi:16S rRNA (cytosine1402-N4)-methyltransferase [Natronocella acetinitrilica]|uniref:Ribosomal RNA small subunit methyltransferase H n=1 Tax=Natronocella acetinitrilica TaxID=414046 RepID=A0AAE3KBP8_9GAMM|nr:16S rRNA (cytosine(1402)-N(4))-methyltransferase RsmH [Natronocella acetinitrilica]MCP1673863.1 16S rRNA (cytosine1402-N4)-methyltransferase [Natronocella acetinitrilica]